MSRPFEILIGLRYIRSATGRSFISFISITSMLGIALGVAVLIVVLSVMNGFEKELRLRILGMASHATITGLYGPLADWRATRDAVDRNSEVVASAPFIEGQGMLVNGTRISAVLVRGIVAEQESRVADVSQYLQQGSLAELRDGEFGIVLGGSLAEALDVTPGDKVLLMISKANVTPAGIVPRMRRFTVQGIFRAGMHEFDRGLAFLAMQDAARLFQTGDGVTGVRLRLNDLYRAPQVVREIAMQLGGGFYVNDWTRKHANFFRSIQLTKSVMFIILLLVVGVAAFNIVSTLVMVVKDKQGDIAILRTIGAAPASVMAVFIVQGLIIGLVGTVVGIAGGMLLAINIESIVRVLEGLLGFQFLAPSVYYISDLPAQVERMDVLTIGLVAFGLSILSTLYPAWRAARSNPAEALRYE